MLKQLLLALILWYFTTHIAQAEIQEPRTTISQDVKSFATSSDWEGVYGGFDSCNPSSVVPGWCYEQQGLNIYDCMRINEYHYEDSQFICKLGAVIREFPDKANPNEHMICDSTSFPGEVEIVVEGMVAHPTQKYYDELCGEATNKAQCRKNVQFSLKKDNKGIIFHSSKGLDSMTCQTPIDERNAGTLQSHYPNLKISFDCAKEDLSKVEKGICNSFYTAREDYMLNIAYRFIMDFAEEATAKETKKEQMQWLKQRNLQCSKAQNTKELESCLLETYSKRTKELKTMVQNTPKQFVKLHSQTGQIPIFQSPHHKSAIIYTATENDKYEAFLANKKTYKGFTKVVFHNLDKKTNPNNNQIIGYIRTQNLELQ